MVAVKKDERLALRVTAAQKDLVERAAATAGQTVTDFAVAAAVERASAVVAESFHLAVDQQTWDWFTGLLDRPAQPLPGLAKVLRGKSPFTA
jgi:uncharacterized protein (DUF1778 family)